MATDKVFWISTAAMAANILVVAKIFYRVYWNGKVLKDFPKFKYQKDLKKFLLILILLAGLFILTAFLVISIIAAESYGMKEITELSLGTATITVITLCLYALYLEISALGKKAINDYAHTLEHANSTKS